MLIVATAPLQAIVLATRRRSRQVLQVLVASLSTANDTRTASNASTAAAATTISIGRCASGLST